MEYALQHLPTEQFIDANIPSLPFLASTLHSTTCSQVKHEHPRLIVMHVMYRDRITRMIFATVITDVVIAIIYLLTSYKYFFKKNREIFRTSLAREFMCVVPPPLSLGTRNKPAERLLCRWANKEDRTQGIASMG